MNCAERLVGIFGSQAEVARAFQLDRAVVHHWVKTGYVPVRWAGEVERVTQGRVSAVDILNEASAKNPVRVKSRPDDAPFGITAESQAMTQFAPTKRITSFHPPQRTLMGPGPTEIHPRVLTTMSQPAIGYLDPVFVEMMEELKSLLRYVYQTKNLPSPPRPTRDSRWLRRRGAGAPARRSAGPETRRARSRRALCRRRRAGSSRTAPRRLRSRHC
jgi:hypothetical protein